MASIYTSATEAEITRMRTEHASWIRAGSLWSLRELFRSTDCDIEDYCRDFRPSRFGEQACREVERYCRKRDIWIEAGGANYNSMTPFLHPGSLSADRLVVIGLFNAILFWLNDTVGREKFGLLSTTAQQQARTQLDRLCYLLESGVAPEQPTGLELATIELLSRLDAHTVEAAWFDRFLESTLEHLRVSIRDQNARARADVLTVNEYVDLRTQVSGMYPAILLCEFGRDAYVDHEILTSMNLDGDLLRMRVLTAEIGALMNDLFSFERECINHPSDFNLIPICLLNHPSATLGDAIQSAADLVRERFAQFRRLRAELIARCDAPDVLDTAQGSLLRAHLDDLNSCVQATWVWQLSTSRYKGASIFVETNVAAGVNHRK